MTTAVLPLTEDEERELRETLAHEHDPLKTGRATSMAEAIQMQRDGYDAVTIYEGDVAKCHISNGGNARVCWEDVGPSLLATLDAERAKGLASAPLPAPSVREQEFVGPATEWLDACGFVPSLELSHGNTLAAFAGHVAAQRGEPLNEYEEQALRLAPANTYTSSDITKLWDTIDLLRHAPPYLAPIVEAVRALEALLKADSNGYALCPGEWQEFRAALASLPKELRDAAHKSETPRPPGR